MMRKWTISLLLIILVANNTFGKIDRASFHREGDILIIDDWNYKNVLKTINFILAVCHEKDRDGRLAVEEFTKAKKVLINECEDLDFAHINLDRYAKVRDDYPMDLVPKIRLFKKNKFIDYHGTITEKHIITWAHRAMNIPLEIKIAKELDDLKKTSSVILGVFPNKMPKEEYEAFVEASENYIYDPKLELPRFAVLTEKRLLRELGLSEGQVVVYKKFEGGDKAVFQGNVRDHTALEKFLVDESYPYVHKYNFEGEHKKVNSLSTPYRHCLFMDPNDPNFKSTYKNFRDAARTYSVKNKEVVFVYSDPKEVREDTMIGYFHIDTKRDLPCNRMMKRDRMASKFRPTRPDFSYRGFLQFTDDVVAGAVGRSIKSQAQPSDWSNGDVKVLVGTTYESFIHQNKQKAVFILYYGSGQKKSEQMIPEFEKAASLMKKNETVVFGKLDVINNDGEMGSDLDFPSMILHFPGGERSKKYNGNKFTAEEYVRFVKTGGTSTPPDAHEKMMEDLAKEMVKMDAQLEEDMIKADEERIAQWEKDEKEALEKAVTRQEGQTLDEMPEHIKYEREHADNPLEHNVDEHVEAAIGHYDL